MTRKNSLPLIGIAILTSINLATAEPVKMWSPAELYERSEIVVVGRPTSVEATEKTDRFQHGKRSPAIPVRVYSAKVNVIATIKGIYGKQVPKEITITFSTKDLENMPEVNPAPVWFWVKEGQMFLLYLKKGDGDTYVGALDPLYYNGQASRLLSNNNTEQDGADQSATAPDPKSEGNEKPKPESEVRPQ